ncbi:MAG TPA: helix-turn-helix transcriptional regulator [Pseudonocardiaceae bacterium]|nr:helix-turn-helix transcriptional regulator [Pseudonocardiaceae bacterium]
MGSRRARQYYCRCGTHLAKDNTERQCARCQRASRNKLITPPEVPAEFWDTEQFKEAFAAQHIGRVFRAYRTHPHHHAVYGPDGISQTLLGQWLGLRQPQVSKIEIGPPIPHLDRLQHWARVLRIPAELLWFRLPENKAELAVAEPETSDLGVCDSNGLRELLGARSNGAQPGSDTHTEDMDDPDQDPVLVAPWNHRGTVEAVVVLSGGGRVKRRMFLSLTGPALTAPAHQWLVHEPEAVVSGLAGHRVSAGVVDRLPAMIAELRTMDDAAGGGDVLSLAQYHFGWVAGLLNKASYDDTIGRKLHIALAELGQLIGWVCYDTGQHGLAQRYCITALRATHAADNRPLGAHILGQMAYQAAHQGQPTEAVMFIDTAVAGTRGRQTPRLLAELSIRKAHAFAALNDTAACTAAITQARTHVEQAATDDDQSYLYWVRPAEITSSAGECLLQLGQPDRAVVLIDEGIAMFDAPFDRDRQYYLTYLAEARAQPGRQRDLDAAASKGIEAIQLAEGLSSTLNVDRIRSLTRLMKPHGKISAVQEFLEQAKGFIKR